jgi:hypothetical protein
MACGVVAVVVFLGIFLGVFFGMAHDGSTSAAAIARKPYSSLQTVACTAFPGQGAFIEVGGQTMFLYADTGSFLIALCATTLQPPSACDANAVSWNAAPFTPLGTTGGAYGFGSYTAAVYNVTTGAPGEPGNYTDVFALQTTTPSRMLPGACTQSLAFGGMLGLGPSSSILPGPYWTWDGPGRSIAFGGAPDPTVAARLDAAPYQNYYFYFFTLVQGWLWPAGAGASPRDGAYDTLSAAQIYAPPSGVNIITDSGGGGNALPDPLYVLVGTGLVQQFPAEFQLSSDWSDTTGSILCLVCNAPLAAGVTADSINRKYPPLALGFRGATPPGLNAWMDKTCGTARCGESTALLNVPAAAAYMSVYNNRLVFFLGRRGSNQFTGLGGPFLNAFHVVYDKNGAVGTDPSGHSWSAFQAAYFTV